MLTKKLLEELQWCVEDRNRLLEINQKEAKMILKALGKLKSNCKKVTYKKRKQAERAALAIEAKGSNPLYPYYCRQCKKFHLTSQYRKTLKH